MLYIRLCYDKPGQLELREEKRAEHRAYLKSQPLRLLVAGPLCVDDTHDTNIASFMIVEADSREAVVEMHDGDPFTKAGVFGDVHIHRWDKHIG
jgi:uncharacterized protein YciI